MTESIGTARLDIVVDTSSLDAGVNKAKRSTQDMAKASQDASQKMDAGTKRQVQALERQIATLGKSRSEVIRWRIEQQTSGRVASDLTAKLDAQTKKLSAVSATMNKVGASAKAAVVGWASLLAASVSVGAAFAGIKNSIDFADKLNDLNQRLGISAEALSGWAYAAKQTGTDIDALGVGMKKLAKNMAEALDPKSSQANLFSALGVSVKDARGNLRSLEDVLPEVADGFKGIKNETLKLALAQELLGKSGADLIEFFNQGADGLGAMRDRARELGIELSQGTLSGADQFNDKLADLRTVSAALFTQIAAELLPSLTKLVDKLTELAREGNESGSVVKWIGDQAEAAAKDFDFFSRSIGEFSDLFREVKIQAASTLGLLTSIAQLDFSGAAGSFASLMGARDRTISLLKDGSQPKSQTPDVKVPGLDLSLPFERQPFSAVPLAGVGVTAPNREAAVNRALAEGRTGGGSKPKKEGKTDAEREIERLENAYKSFAESQRERIALFGEESEAAKVRYEVENGALKNLSEAKKRELIGNAERIDQLRDEAEVQKELDRINQARAERTQNVLEDIRAEIDLLGKSAEYQDTYNKLKYAGVDANSAFGQSIIDANEQLHDQAKATARQTELMDTWRVGAADALSKIATDFDNAGQHVKDFFDGIAERITQMIAERWIERAFGELGTTDGGASGGILGKLFGFVSGDTGGDDEAAGLSKAAGELAASAAPLLGAATALSSAAAALAAAGAANGASNTGDSSTGWISTLFGMFASASANGNVFNRGEVTAFANGGVIGSPTMFPMPSGRLGLMGEAGPEAIMPLSRGRDGKLGVRVEGGTTHGDFHMTQNVVIQGRMTNETQNQLELASFKGGARAARRR